MTFGHPWALLFLVGVVPAGVVLLRRGARAGEVSRAATLLQLLALVCLCLALADPQVERPDTPVHVIAVAVGDSARAAGDDAVAALRRADGDARVERIQVDSQVSLGDGSPPETAPDLARGLAVARGLVPSGASGRITLVSDGSHVGPSFHDEVSAITRRGIAFDVVAVRGDRRPALLSVDHPSAVRAREPFTLRARVRASEPTSGHLVVESRGAVLARHAAKLDVGTTTLAMDLSIEALGVADLRTRFVIGVDTTASGFEERSAVDVTAPPIIAHVIPGVDGSDPLASLLAPFGFDVRVVDPGHVAPALFREASAWVVDDVAADRWEATAQEELRRAVLEEGSGLLLAGAHQNLGPGGYGGSPLADILPVDFPQEEERRDPSVGLVLIIDTSGSMGGARIELAKEVARLALKRLQPHDKVGIVEFYGSKRWAAPLQSASNAIEIQRALNRLQAGGGTIIYSAIEEAFHALRAATTRFRQILVLTDGGVESGPFDVLARQIAESGINLNTVLIGPQGNSPFLQNLANWGRGRFYSCPSRFQLPDLSFREPQTSPSSAVRDARMEVDVSMPVDALRVWAGHAMPAIGALTNGTARPGASTWISTRDGRPVLTAWDQGCGRAAVLATELFGPASAEWRSDGRFGAGLADLLRALGHGSRAIVPAVDVQAFPHRLLVSGRTAGVDDVTVSLRTNTGALAAAPARCAADGTWRAAFEWPSDSPVVIEAETDHVVARGAAVRPLSRSERAEDVTADLAMLREHTARAPAVAARPRSVPRRIAPIVLVAALLAYIAQLFVRRTAPRGGIAVTAALVLWGTPAAAQSPAEFQATIQETLMRDGRLDALRARADSRPSWCRVAIERADGDLEAALAAVDRADASTRIELLERLGRLADAESELHLNAGGSTAEDRLHSTWMSTQRALLRLAQGRPDEASKDVDSVVSNATAEDRAFFVRLLALWGQRAKALALDTRKTGELSLGDSLRRAMWLSDAGRVPEALDTLELAYGKAALDRDRRFLLARSITLARRGGLLAELATRWTRSLTPEDVTRRTGLLQALRELGRADEALALASASTDGDLRQEALAIAAELGRTSDVIERARAALVTNPKDGRARRFLALTLAENRRLDEADAVLREAVVVESRIGELVGWAEAAGDLGLAASRDLAIERLSGQGENGRVAAALVRARDLRNRRKLADAAVVLVDAAKAAEGPANLAALASELEAVDKRTEAIEVLQRVWGATGSEDVGARLAQLLADGKQQSERDRALAIQRELWLRPGTAARRVQAEERVLDAAAREGTLADLAIELEEGLAAAGPDHDARLDALLKIYSRARDAAGGSAILAEEMKRRPEERVRLTERLAQLQLECEEFTAYERTLRELIVMAPANELDYRQQLAMSALERGRPADAAKVVRDLVSRGGMLPETAFEFSAGIFNLAGDHQSAAAAYRRTLALHPDRIETWLLLGDALRNLGESDRAIGIFSDLIKPSARDDLFVVAVDGLLNMDANPRIMAFAEMRIRERLASRPDTVFLLRLLQDVLEQRRDEKGRAVLLDELVIAAGEQRVAFLREAMDDARTASDWQRYSDFGHELLMLEDDAPPAVFLELGEVLLKRKDLRGAEQAFGRARMANEFDAIEQHIAELYAAGGSPADAARVRARILLRHPEDPAARLALAKLWEQLGRHAEAGPLFVDAAVMQLASPGSAPAEPPDLTSGGGIAGALSTVRLVSRADRAQEAAADEAMAGAARCASRPSDLGAVVDRLKAVARDSTRRDRPMALDRLRELAVVFRSDDLAGEVGAIEAEWLGAADPVLVRAVVAGRDRIGDVDGAVAAAKAQPAARFDRPAWRAALLAGKGDDALSLAANAPPEALLQTLQAFVLDGDLDRARRALDALRRSGAGRERTIAAQLRKAQATLGEPVTADSRPPDRGIDDALASKGRSRVQAVISAVRASKGAPVDRKVQALLAILPEVRADATGNTAASFVGAARGVLPAEQTTELVEKALQTASMPVLVGIRLRDLDMVVPERRLEIAVKALDRLKGEEANTALLSLFDGQAAQLSEDLLLGLVKKLAARRLDQPDLTRLSRIVANPALPATVRRALVDHVGEARPDDPAVLVQRAGFMPVGPERDALADRAAKAFAAQKRMGSGGIDLANEIAALLGPDSLRAAAGTDSRPAARLLAGLADARSGNWKAFGDAVRDLGFDLAEDVSAVMQTVSVMKQLGRIEDAAGIYQRHLARASQVYPYHAQNAAELLLRSGKPAEALAALGMAKSDLGEDPSLRLRVGARLPDATARRTALRVAIGSSGRSTLVPSLVARNDDDGGSLAEALARPTLRPRVPSSLKDCESLRAGLDVLGFVPEGADLVAACRRAAAITMGDLGLAVERARVRSASASGGLATLLQEARAALAARPFDRDALRVLVAAIECGLAKEKDAPMRLAHVALLRDRTDWKLLVEMARVLETAGDKEEADRLLAIIAVDRETLSGLDLADEARDLIAMVASRDPARLMRLVPAGDTPQNDFDGELLSALTASDVPVRAIVEAYPTMQSHFGDGGSRYRMERLALPWVGVMLRAGNRDGLLRTLGVLATTTDDLVAARLVGAAVPPLRSWTDRTIAEDFATAIRERLASPNLKSRFLFARLGSVLARRLDEGGEADAARALWASVEAATGGIPGFSAWRPF